MNITENLLTINTFSRPGTPLHSALALIMHWTAVPRQRAIETRQYFEDRKNGTTGYGSAHYIIDMDGSIIRCIPESEVAYHVGSNQVDPASGKIYTDWARAKFGVHIDDPQSIGPNICTLGIEMEPIDAPGTFTVQTLDAAGELAADICRRLQLDPLVDLATHHQVVGWKDCPRLWTSQPALVDTFRQDVKSRMVS
jgi:N-acetylmuramoyl-L-alanine amidase